MKNKIDILVVEDDADLGLLLTTMLKFSGFTVYRCDTPSCVMEKIDELKPELVLTDMLLSGFDGRDICKMVKAAKDHAHVKVMMMSAHPDAEETCRDAGADEFIFKPFDMDELVGKASALLGKV